MADGRNLRFDREKILCTIIIRLISPISAMPNQNWPWSEIGGCGRAGRPASRLCRVPYPTFADGRSCCWRRCWCRLGHSGAVVGTPSRSCVFSINTRSDKTPQIGTWGIVERRNHDLLRQARHALRLCPHLCWQPELRHPAHGQRGSRPAQPRQCVQLMHGDRQSRRNGGS
jgi:hypothetical protein